MAVTVLSRPTFFVSNVAVPPTYCTASVKSTPARSRPVIVAAVVASYTLSAAVMLPTNSLRYTSTTVK